MTLQMSKRIRLKGRLTIHMHSTVPVIHGHTFIHFPKFQQLPCMTLSEMMHVKYSIRYLAYSKYLTVSHRYC